MQALDKKHEIKIILLIKPIQKSEFKNLGSRFCLKIEASILIKNKSFDIKKLIKKIK